MAARAKWTEHEEEVLLSNVKQSPENLKEAFRKTGDEIGRSPNACATRWYSKVSYDTSTKGIAFAIFARNKYNVNRKNPSKRVSLRTQHTLWSSIIRYLQKILTVDDNK